MTSPPRRRARWSMVPRHRLDVSPADLVFAVGASALPADRAMTARLAAEIGERWLTVGRSVVTLSVRSGFDAYLTASAFPRGSEVLTSGITIPDIPRILRAHGLVPVPFDLDPTTLRPDVDGARAALSPKTCAILFAHLFGGRADVSELIGLAKHAGVVFVEDCAQSFQGPTDWGHPDADLSMFSFGIIKTSTALGGAIFRVTDAALAARIDAVQATWPAQTHGAYATRAARLLGLSAVASGPTAYGALTRSVAARGHELDTVLGSLTRGFGAADDDAFFASVRRRPSRALVTMLDRRLATFDASALAARARFGEALVAAVQQPAFVPGLGQPRRTHWLVPVSTPSPDFVVRRLRAAGFDATRGATSLVAVPAVGASARAATCESLMDSIAYVPGYPAMGQRAGDRLRAALADVTSSG